jgi:hypothetical protein
LHQDERKLKADRGSKTELAAPPPSLEASPEITVKQAISSTEEQISQVDKTNRDSKPCKLRVLTLEDFTGAQEEVSASVSSDAASMGELQRWNEMYGEGGNRRSSTLTYFM